ncbi:MAG: hypothetical protein WCS42_17970 [Verrucomicrobiota bacterium]
MEMLLIAAGAYGSGCCLALLFFLTGRSPALIENRNWPWPIIFLWPLLMLWPVSYLLKKSFATWKARRPEQSVLLSATLPRVQALVPAAGAEVKTTPA